MIGPSFTGLIAGTSFHWDYSWARRPAATALLLFRGPVVKKKTASYNILPYQEISSLALILACEKQWKLYTLEIEFELLIDLHYLKI
jgi:hypothetical protein